MLDRLQQPKIQTLEHFTMQQPDRIKLDNGMDCALLNSGEADVVKVDIVIKGGRWIQNKPLQTIMTAAMLDQGTKRYDASMIAEKLDYYGAWLEVGTTPAYTYITLHSLNKYFAQTFDIISSILKESIFPESEYELTLSKKKYGHMMNLSRGEYLAMCKLQKELFGDAHPWGRTTQTEDYDHIFLDDVKAYYHEFFHSNNCSVYLSGKITDEVIRIVNEGVGVGTFGNTQNGIRERVDGVLPVPAQKRSNIAKEDAIQTTIRMGMHTIGYRHEDFLDMKIMLTVFGGYFGSRLMSNIREDKGYTYGISSDIESDKEKSIVVIRTNTAHEYKEDLIKQVYYEMGRLKQDLIDDKELQIVKNYLIGGLCRSYESPFVVADAWIDCDIKALGSNLFEKKFNAIRNISEDRVRDLAQKYLVEGNIHEVVVSP